MLNSYKYLFCFMNENTNPIILPDNEFFFTIAISIVKSTISIIKCAMCMRIGVSRK